MSSTTPTGVDPDDWRLICSRLLSHEQFVRFSRTRRNDGYADILSEKDFETISLTDLPSQPSDGMFYIGSFAKRGPDGRQVGRHKVDIMVLCNRDEYAEHTRRRKERSKLARICPNSAQPLRSSSSGGSQEVPAHSESSTHNANPLPLSIPNREPLLIPDRESTVSEGAKRMYLMRMVYSLLDMKPHEWRNMNMSRRYF